MSPVTSDGRKSRATWRRDGQSVAFLEFRTFAVRGADEGQGARGGQGAGRISSKVLATEGRFGNANGFPPGPWPDLIDELDVVTG
jgi:hypothetical protein